MKGWIVVGGGGLGEGGEGGTGHQNFESRLFTWSLNQTGLFLPLLAIGPPDTVHKNLMFRQKIQLNLRQFRTRIC